VNHLVLVEMFLLLSAVVVGSCESVDDMVCL